MDAAHIFRQGLGTVGPRQNQGHPFSKGPVDPTGHDGLSDGDGPSHRVAHTLTACCRCRQVRPFSLHNFVALALWWLSC